MSNKPTIILIRPQLGENIGAVARAMGNFGLSELRIVAPRDGWPNPAAEAMAASSVTIIHHAKIFARLEEALSDIQMVYATTARPREMEKPVITPDAAMAEIAAPSPLMGEGWGGGEDSASDAPLLTSPHQGGRNIRTAILFGPERTGLTNEDLGWCHKIITIPTAENASLNIAQSAVVVLYEWFRQSSESRVQNPENTKLRTLDSAHSPATMEQYAHFFDQLEARLDAGAFFKIPEKKPGMWLNIKNMFLRATYSEQELRTLHGIIRALSAKNPLP